PHLYTLSLHDALPISPAVALTALDGHLSSFRLLTLIDRIARADPGLAADQAVPAALSAPAVLPGSIFPVDRSMIPPVGVADDWRSEEHTSELQSRSDL